MVRRACVLLVHAKGVAPGGTMPDAGAGQMPCQ